ATTTSGAFNATISGTAMTVSGLVTGAPLAVGQQVTNTSTGASYGTIVSGSGTSWVLSQSSTVGTSTAMTAVSGSVAFTARQPGLVYNWLDFYLPTNVTGNVLAQSGV